MLSYPGNTWDEQFNIPNLKKQDGAEFERLYHAFSPQLLIYLFRLCGDQELARDLLQETFVKAYNALPRLTSDTIVRPWLYKIATNSAHSAMRTASWKRVITFSKHPAAEKVELCQPFEHNLAESETVARALKAIKPEYAGVLLLHWHEGFCADEICRIMGISKEALKKRLYRAKKAFIQAFTQESRED